MRLLRFILVIGVSSIASAQPPGKFPPDSLINTKVFPHSTPVIEVVGAMRNFTSALGVRCQFCHVGREGQPLSQFDFASGALTPGPSIGLDHPMLRLNDGKADPQGRFLAGTMHGGRAADEPPLGGLYRLDASGGLELLETGLGVTNGPCFSPDGRTFYVGDSARRMIWAYDYGANGPLANKRVFVDTDTLNSGPDGATVDAEGHLWSVLVRIGAVARFAPDGRIVRSIEMPVRHPTSIAFGGPDLDVLFVTSISRSTHLSDDHPDAGGLFAIEGLGVKGLPAHRFAAD